MPTNNPNITIVMIGCNIASTFASLIPKLKILLINEPPLFFSNSSPLLDLIRRISDNFSLASALKSAVAACNCRPKRDIIRPIGIIINAMIGTAKNIIAAIFQSITNRIIIDPTNWIAPVIKLGNCVATKSLITVVSFTSRELLSPDL